MRRISSTWHRLGYAVLFAVSVGVGAVATVAVLVHSVTDLRAPKVIGQTTEAAMRFVAAQHLALHSTGERFSEEFPRGSILEQIPAPGEPIRAGRSIGIVVSLGARDRIAPQVVGVKWEAAETILRTAELNVSEIVRACSDRISAGSLISQEPPAGSPVVARSIALLMSIGPCRAQFVTFGLVGENLALALERLDRQGFRNRSLNYVSTTDAPQGSVLSVVPREGLPVGPTDLITLTVAAPSPPSSEESASEELSSGRLQFLRVAAAPGFFGHLIRIRYEGPGAPTFETRERQVLPGEAWEELAWVPADAEVWVEIDGRRIWRKID